MNNFSAPAAAPSEFSRLLWLVASATLPFAAWFNTSGNAPYWPLGAAALGLVSALRALIAPRPLSSPPAPSGSAREARARVAAGAVMDQLSAALGRASATSDRLVESLADCAARTSATLNVVQTALQAGQRADVASRALSSALKEAEEQIFATRKAVADALRKTGETERLVVGLTTRAGEIGEIVAAIEDLAGQTHLAALNAAIESARAKPTSNVLSPVAQEFKTVSQQTARASRRLREQADAMKLAGHAAAEAIAALRFGVSEADELAEATVKTTRARCRASDGAVRDAYETAAGARAVYAHVDAIDSGLKLAIAGAGEARERNGETRERAERLRAILEPAAAPAR